MEEACPGDLAFFDNEDGRIIHAGIILPDCQIIHASGRVRLDSIDHQGIFNADRGIYTNQLRMLRRVVG